MTITALKAAGLPSVVGVLQGLELLAGKKRLEMRKWGQRFFETHFGDEVKSVDASDPRVLVRHLCTTPTRRIHWRSIRSYMLADSVKVVSDDADEGRRATLYVRGYVRGRPLNVDQLVHLTDLGHFKMKQINWSSDPCPLKPRREGGSKVGRVDTPNGEASHVLAVAKPVQQEDLEMEAPVDGLSGEQTWPADYELAQAKNCSESPLATDAVEVCHGRQDSELDSNSFPKGKSRYQASWYEATGGSEEDEDVSDGGETWAHDECSKDGADDDLTVTSVQMAERRRAEDEDGRFPDEVDTPTDRLARHRFARYRALKSFRTSSWDPKESLPADYARIFQVRPLLTDTLRTVCA